MQQRHGTLIGCTDNIVEVELSADAMLAQGEIGYIELPDKDVTVQVMAEVLEVRENSCVMQVFEPTEGLCNGLKVTFSGDPLSIQVGPGMLGTVYDGLQNPLKELAHRDGFFLKRGSRVDPLDSTKMWDFVPTAKIGDTVAAGQVLGCVKEFHFEHKIMVPFDLSGDWEVISIESQGECCVSDTIAVIKN
ncbi:V-type ATP synthase subunit A, partial [Candidatus Peregrinibacteria bacterium]|nr:V-type ATP synthase subunit A [Candidatus Peregrinibacteria bacterium]